LRFVIFTHSLVSDWNHGNAHFLRGITTDLQARGHEVRIYEPHDSWSRTNLVAEYGPPAEEGFRLAYPHLQSELYHAAELDLDAVLAGADVVIVHEWNEHGLVARIGQHHERHRHYRLYFHDTHHRSATDPASMQCYDLRGYDGVLAYGGVIRDIYRRRGWARDAWVWHEAADVRVFRPLPPREKQGDLVWIGNWGDEERTEQLREFLIEPVKALRLKTTVYGVRYPRYALDELAAAGIEYGGWLPNYRVPEVFSRFRATVHVPRRPYVEALPGIPTIRPFEALACGIPLVSSPWEDRERLFRANKDFLFARDGAEMKAHLATILANPETARRLSDSGLETVRARHTCAHRVDELLALTAERN
jgi:spore maturation protein CgeB